MKIQIHITTHKRPEWCYYLLRQIKEQQKHYNIHVVAFHDLCDSDYSKAIEFCKENGWEFLQTKDNLGKWKYWKLLNYTYEYAEKFDYDYYIALPDDIVLVDNFFKRAVSMPNKRYPMINFFTMNIHYDMYLISKKVRKVNGVLYFVSGWVDGCFIATKEYMKGLQIYEPAATRKRMNLRGTGIAHELIKHYNSKVGNVSLQSCYALCEHIGNVDTVMHDIQRRRVLYKSVEGQKDRIQSSLLPEDKEFVEMKIKEYGIKRTEDG